MVAFDGDDAWPAPQPIVVESAQTAVAFGTPPDEQLTTTPATPSFPVRVRVLGPAHVEAFGEVVTSGLRQSAYELLSTEEVVEVAIVLSHALPAYGAGAPPSGAQHG